ncbi:MAG: two-component sensor histidine kinase, partial [Gorillibacterium sp.]|nr:two-component sensor histidine kinase [Gorillibacterium sp.]
MDLSKEILLQLFFALLPFIMFNIYYRDKPRNFSRKFILITCTISLFLSVTFSYHDDSGVICDIRYIIIYFGMIFGGWQTGFILLLEFVIYRLYLGGPEVWVALAIPMFPLLILFYIINKRTQRFVLVTILAGITFTIIPYAITYFLYI